VSAAASFDAWLRLAIAEARARPYHVVLGALVAGLVLGPLAPGAMVLAAAAAALLAGRPPAAACAAAAVLAGALLAQARLAALDHTALRASLGHATSARVTLLEAPRRGAFGGRSATVRMRGERVLLRARRGVGLPGEVGEQLLVRGGLAALGPHDGWLRPRNVHAILLADSITATGRRRGGLPGILDRARSRIERALRVGLPPPQAALLGGMVLGEDGAMDDATRADFRASGLSHLVAASGQNVMLLAALALPLAGLLGLGLPARLLAVLALVALYVPLAGGGPSIQRAGVMAAAGLAASLAGRPASRVHALLLAAGATLLLNPRADQDPAWQLSFAAVVAILLLAGRVRAGLERRGLPAPVAEAAALTAAATIGTAPLIALHFGRTSLVSLPANVLAAPAVAPIMWLGMLAGVAGQLAPAAAAPFTLLAGYPLAYLTWLAHAAASLPHAQLAIAPAAVAVGCAVAAATVLSRRARRLARAAALACLALTALALAGGATGAAGARPPGALRVSFLDVGQGDATLVQHGSRAVLVDTGPPGAPVLARLRAAGVRRLDLLVVTHAQADHDGNAAAILRALPVGLVLDGRDGVRQPAGVQMAAAAAARGVRRVVPFAGETVRDGPMTLRVLSPAPEPFGARAGQDPNLRAIVAELRDGRFRMLLTADAESDVLQGLDLEHVDVLKVSHHGSADAGLPGVLARLRPALAAIEVGAHNPYGHPATSTLRALAAARVPVVRTDRDGTVRVDVVGAALRVQTHA
jgi:competence protein ComEC